MRTFALLFLTACGSDAFVSIPLEVPPDSGTQATEDAATEVESSNDAAADAPPDSGTEGSTSQDGATDAKPPLCSDLNDVEHNGKCFYLDGSGGLCDQGYQRSTNAKLAAILLANPNAWEFKNYRHKVSDNACVLTQDNVQNYGMQGHANVPGPFSANEPIVGGSGCFNISPPLMQPKQLTLCEKQ